MSEKTEQASPQRVRKAREDGDVAKSGEFTGVMVLMTAGATLIGLAPTIMARMVLLLREALTLVGRPDLDISHAQLLVASGIKVAALAVGPMLAVAFASAAFFSYIQVGALFTLKPLMPDANKMNPINGLKGILSKDKVVELVKNLGKIGLMAVVAHALFMDALPALLLTSRLELTTSMTLLGATLKRVIMTMIGAMLVFGVADIFWQRHKHSKKLMMSKDEVKREHKESDGDPMLKGQRQQLHHELLSDPGVRHVKDADAVVVNPTHVACAIRYRNGEMRAPQVIASGKGKIAQQIRQEAKRHQIPIVRNVPLARALVELEHEQDIPEELFEAVAEVLHFVYQLRQGS